MIFQHHSPINFLFTSLCLWVSFPEKLIGNRVRGGAINSFLSCMNSKHFQKWNKRILDIGNQNISYPQTMGSSASSCVINSDLFISLTGKLGKTDKTPPRQCLLLWNYSKEGREEGGQGSTWPNFVPCTLLASNSDGEEWDVQRVEKNEACRGRPEWLP